MSDIDHEYTPEIVCPYCGYEHGDSSEVCADNGDYDCHECGETFFYTRNITIYYSTERKEPNAERTDQHGDAGGSRKDADA